MLFPYCVYAPDTGEILRTGHCSTEILARSQHQPGERFLMIDADPRLHYIEFRQRIDRPTLVAAADVAIVADDDDAFAVSDVPAGTRVTVLDRRSSVSASLNGAGDVIDDGEFVFSTAHPGAYEVVIRPPFPYQLQRVRVQANAV